MRTLLLLTTLALPLAHAAQEKPRLLVLTDIGGDPDDEQSLVRLLLYSNVFDIEGLIATTLVHNDKPRGDGWTEIAHPELIRERIEAYGKVRENLMEHAGGFPEKETLLKTVKSGWGSKKTLGVGKDKDTEGSEWLIAAADRDDPRSLWIAVWGGTQELAQALWKVQATRPPDAAAKWRSKLRVYSIVLSQAADKSGEWIKKEFPDLNYIVAHGPTPQKSLFRGMYQEGDLSTTTPQWLDANIRDPKSPLGALYPQDGAGVKGLKEGDTPSFLFLIPNGLGDPTHPEWGGWGGRFLLWDEAASKSWFADIRTADAWNGLTNADAQRKASVARWRPDFQNDFAARMAWCTKSFADANHAPEAHLDGDASLKILERGARPGEALAFSAAGSKDTDGDALAYEWFLYPEAGNYSACDTVKLAANADACALQLPPGAQGKLHLLLRVRDAGTPPLASYRRAVIDVKP